MPEPLTPPDLIGAGVAQQPTEPSSLISLLRSQGSLPSAALQSLTPQPPALGQSLASALAGGVALQQGVPNPVAQQQAQAQQQQLQQAQLLERIQDQRQRAARQRQEDLLKISDTFLKADDEASRRFGAKIRGDAAKAMGIEVPQDALVGLVTRRVDADEQKQISSEFERGFDPRVIQSNHPTASPQLLQEIQKARGSDTSRRLLGLPTVQDEKLKALDVRIKEGQAAEAGHPEFRGDGKVIQAATVIHQQRFGKSYLDGDGKSQTDALAFARQQVQAEDDRRIRLQSQVSLDRALTLAQAKSSVQSQKPLTPLQKQKLLDPIQRVRATLQAMDQIEAKIDAMDKLEALPTGDSYAAQLAAKGKRELFLRGNQNVITFKQLWAPVSVGQIDRGLFDEKNVRFKAAFDQQTGLIDNMPPAAAMKEYLKTVRSLIQDKLRDNITDWEDSGFPPDIVGVAKRVLGQVSGQPVPLPTGPLTPPADLIFDPKTRSFKTGRP